MNNDDLKIRFATSVGTSLRNVDNQTWDWSEFVNRLKPERFYVDRLTHAEFKAISKDNQAKRKASHGYFAGSHYQGGVRHKNLMSEKQLITFDIDAASEKLVRDLRDGTSGLGDIEYVVYSTHTHGGGDVKLRIVIPLAKRLPKDQFQALARILAWMIDPHMKTVDPVSFHENQLMYWPARCADIEPIFIHQRGALVNVQAVLTDWGDWKDHGLLPRSPKEGAARERVAKAQDPTEKRGLVGALCRIYDVHDIINEFLDDVYAASEVGPDGVPFRYTYLPGTTSNGAVVYDDGRKLHSHHGSDPICDMNVNAYDLLRIHKFGHLDKPGDLDKPAVEQPSYKATAIFLREDAAVQRELRDSFLADDDDFFADSVAEAPPEGAEAVEAPAAATPAPKPPARPESPKDWRDALDLNDKGIIKNTLPNIALILTHGPNFRDMFAYDEFIHDIVALRPLISRTLGIDLTDPFALGGPVSRITDLHLAAIRAVLDAPRGKHKPGWGLRASMADIREALALVADRFRFHPVRDYLGGLAWDGVSRIDQLWIKACHTPDTPYFRETARLFMIGAVARVFEPGCKFDFMPIVEGPQGLLKTTLINTLGGLGWTGESDGYFDNIQKFVESTLGFWFVEIPELAQFSRADVRAIKTTITRRSDHVRLSYRKNPETFDRGFVLSGTTNENTYLRDRTGNRRFWPVPCGPGQIDIPWVRADRDQLWAEATAAYLEMRRACNSVDLPLYLTGAAAEEAERMQNEKIVADVADDYAGQIEEWLETPAGLEDVDAFGDTPMVLRTVTCAHEVFDQVISGGRGSFDQRWAHLISNAMAQVNGWEKAGRASCGRYGQQRITYRRKDL